MSSIAKFPLLRSDSPSGAYVDPIGSEPALLGDNESYKSTTFPNFGGSLNQHRDSYGGLIIPNRRTLQRIVTSRDRKCLPSLSFHNITYTVEQRRNFIGTAESHTILKGISAIMKPGINAIIGPSGCGKTTLLDVLSGKKDARDIDGVVLVNGKKQQPNFKYKSGYVVQQDLITSTLTVRENVAFSAFVRLSSETPADEREKRVDDVIVKMDLENCANTRIGDELIRGVSGGERKRTSIGMELVTNPSILFLDEPTTGLDAATALRVMNVLRSISRDENKIIIMSIHQPRYSIYKLINQITLLSKGEIIYHGSRSDATSYFKHLDYERDPEDNPADFFLDTIITNEIATGLSASQEVLDLEAAQESYTATPLVERFKNSREWKKLEQSLKHTFKMQPHMNTASTPEGAHVTSFGRQFIGLSNRNLKNLIRHPKAALTLSLIMMILALIVGTVFFNLDNGETAIRDRMGCFFFSILAMIYLNLASMDLFIQQRAVFIHEKESGFYRVSAYFLSKLLCELLPMSVIPVPVYCAITYFMIGLRIDSAGRYFMYTLTISLVYFAVGSLAMSIGALIGIFSIANPIYVMILTVSIVFSGFLVRLNDTVSWLRWIQYFSVFKYSINILAVNEFAGQNYTYPICFENAMDCNMTRTESGDDFLERESYSDYNVWFNHLGLLLHGIFYLCLAYIFLRTLKRR
ncbi:broad substrate specificity ATP-binding cassette transporter ABCG2-like isoform X2 [Dysidea avara]|uniref:broad substrate specificity ATP-binding cassette transporter ABCG2-like isoform X2 n=1 Tax=Dysidea avara TaxID=196820 RepID=UPI00332433A4